jgi:hypothetical protein
MKDLSQAGEKYRLQNEWQFLHRVIPDIGDPFVPIEEALKNISSPV